MRHVYIAIEPIIVQWTFAKKNTFAKRGRIESFRRIIRLKLLPGNLARANFWETWSASNLRQGHFSSSNARPDATNCFLQRKCRLHYRNKLGRYIIKTSRRKNNPAQNNVAANKQASLRQIRPAQGCGTFHDNCVYIWREVSSCTTCAEARFTNVPASNMKKLPLTKYVYIRT